MSQGHRLEQVASTLHRAVQQVIARGLSDPRIGGLITITGVQLSPDLKQATMLVSVYPEDKQTLTLHGLKDAARYIRREAAELIALRELPQLHFKLDTSLKKQAEITMTLAKLRDERHDHPWSPPPAPSKVDGPPEGEGHGGAAPDSSPGPAPEERS